MQIILLAAGTSSRMQPLSDKSLLKICGKSIIQHQVETILSAGLNEIIFVCNEKNISEIKKIFLENKKFSKFNFDFVIQKNQKDGMKGAIESCEKIIKKDVFIVSSNDIVEKSIFEEIASTSQNKNIFGAICGKVVDKYFPGGYISMDKNGFLKDIVEKPGEGNEPSNKINLVLHYWKNFEVFNKKLKSFDNSTDDAYELCIKYFSTEKCEKIKIIEYKGFWQAIKYPWHLFFLNKYFLNKQEKNKNFFNKSGNLISKDSEIAKNVIIKGDGVVVEKGVKILENAVIVGPAYIGKNSIIGTNSFIRESSIGENCIVGFGTEIARTLVQNNVNFHKNYIGDSIIDSYVNIGGGTIFGNLRLDKKEIHVEIKGKKINSGLQKIGAFIGKGVQLGINLSLNPGIKVGENSLITGGFPIVENVEKNSFIKGNVEIICKKNLLI